MSQAGSASVGGGGLGADVKTLTGNTGGAVGPSVGNINIVGTGSISVAGNSGTHTLTISSSGGGGITTLDGDTGSATGSTVTIAGGSNMNTSATGSTVTVNLDSTVSISGSMTAGTGFVATTGDVNIMAGNIDLPLPNTGFTQGAITLNGAVFLTSDSIGGASVFLGQGAGVSNVSQSSVAVGAFALSTMAAGADRNNAIGLESMAFAVANTGTDNNALGYQSLSNITSGSFNQAIGSSALDSLITGSSNIAIGQQAGANYGSSESNNILLANFGTVADSGVIRIGDTPQTSTFIAGIYGVTPAMSPQMATIGSDGEMGSQALPTGGIVTLDGDSGSATGTTVTIHGGTGITTSATSATVTITNSGVITVDGDTGSATGNTITIAGGTNVTTSATGSTVTINASGGSSFTWTEITASTVAMAIANGYILNNSGGVIATLPSTAAVGSVMEIVGKGSGGWTLAQNSGQTVHFGAQDTTTGTGGSIVPLALPADQYACLSLVCTTANTDFVVKSSVGNFTVT